MFRHGTYYIIANDSDKTLETIVINYANTIGFSYHYEKHVYYITVNGNWIMAVDANNTNLLLLNAYYNIQWEECSCLRGIRLEDVTVELEKEAYEEMRHNI